MFPIFPGKCSRGMGKILISYCEERRVVYSNFLFYWKTGKMHFFRFLPNERKYPETDKSSVEKTIGPAGK